MQLESQKQKIRGRWTVVNCRCAEAEAGLITSTVGRAHILTPLRAHNMLHNQWHPGGTLLAVITTGNSCPHVWDASSRVLTPLESDFRVRKHHPRLSAVRWFRRMCPSWLGTACCCVLS